MYEPRVSVIISTYNRAYHLKRLLDCLSHQRYEYFEVIVINGPSNDGTEKVLRKYKKAIKIKKCSTLNVSFSRNIGVSAAVGEILVFIDDDAIPGNAMWLKELIKHFQNPEVGAVGGRSFRMNGALEFCHGTCSIYGENIGINTESLIPERQTGEYFNGVIGCNCAFRRSAVLQTGGFDEFYSYHMDETDLCYRITRSGYKIIHNDSAIVRHEAAISVNRRSPFHLNWRAIARSSTYFVMKATADYCIPEGKSRKIAKKSCELWKRYFIRIKDESLITEREYQIFQSELEKGISEGISAGIEAERILIHRGKPQKKTFQQFDKRIGRNHKNICYFCQDDMLDRIKQAAHLSALRGNNIFIVTEDKNEGVENIGGVNYCRYVPEKISAYAAYGMNESDKNLYAFYSRFHKLLEFDTCFYFDIVENIGFDHLQEGDLFPLNDEIHFNTVSKENNFKYLKSGFSYPESAFTWTDGNRAELIFIISELQNNLVLELDYLTFYRCQTVGVYANNRLLEKYTASGEERKQIFIPQEYLIRYSDKSKYFCILLLRFELPDARSPKSINLNEDVRNLALAMKTIKIIPCTNNSE